MKLLFDENLSKRLVPKLPAEFSGSSHVEDVGQRGWTDQNVWDFAKQNEYIIISKDNDFRQRAFLYGQPPKVIWLAVGNASTDLILDTLKKNISIILQFATHADESLLVLQQD